MTEDEAYKVHIQYTFNAFCKIVIRHAAIDTHRTRKPSDMAVEVALAPLNVLADPVGLAALDMAAPAARQVQATAGMV